MVSGSAISGKLPAKYRCAFNGETSKDRVTVECLFKELKAYFTSIDFNLKMKVFESPIGSLFLASMLLNNVSNFIYPQ